MNWWIATAALVLAGCVNRAAVVSHRATFDLSCPEDKLTITELADVTYGVTGCDRKATYVVEGACALNHPCVPVLNSPVENAAAKQ